MTEEDWRAEAVRRFGPDRMKWRFVCPACGHVASTEDWKNAGARPQNVAFSCVGRWLNGRHQMGRTKPCDYAGGGLIGLNPVTVTTAEGKEHHMFAFAEAGA